MSAGLHILGTAVGSRYTSRETAGDGSTITAGSRVRYVPGSHSIFDYKMPQPSPGSVGRVVDDFYEFYKQMWAKVEIDGQPNPTGGTWDIRTKDLRSLDASATTSRPEVASVPVFPTRARRRYGIGARSFFVIAAIALAVVIIGGRS